MELVTRVAQAFAKSSGDIDAAARALASSGMGLKVASLRLDLLSTAVGWALLMQMRVSLFPSTFILVDAAGEEREVQISDSKFFEEALSIASNVFAEGYDALYTKELVEMFCKESAEVDGLNRLLNAEPEADLSQVRVGATRLYDYRPDDYRAA